ncbi:KAP family P-loop NTPase fold protein [Lysobacter niastensis]|uniref:KAP NTPase domain-containing protein n=1 Tax=Lysobacter niastensis TaxID=380629 RepID=A0ABS0B8U9_9GAMM|nr:P-loop NTPase fold protein [Lysobacter niastensis]MBF6023444.1 hypothetical protein [Lysobacter niastensis]
MDTLVDSTERAEKRWPDDVLGRDRLADFLTTSLTEQARIRTRSQGTGLTVALDADWGTGKSFFVRHWASDLTTLEHPVVVFDAWENDIGDEAAVALMACIKLELEKWTAKLPNKNAIRNKAKEATTSAIQGLRKAIVPASKVIAAGVLKKATGIVVEEIFDAYTSTSNKALDEISEATSATLEAGLDELFKRSLDEHQKRSAAIKHFKTSISSLIELLEAEANARMPVFVFIDEVDRCRPTYAIKLLEEIKHIFGVSKICFVVTTNLSQLRESVCAIYGAGFDGHRYLKRFFDYQYTLPEPDNESFSAQLLTEGSAISSRSTANGLPARSAEPDAKHAIALIANGFGLDLRSQKQVFSVANSVAAAIPNDKKVFVIWLFFLCALQHKKPDLFEALLHTRLDKKSFDDLCREAFKKDIEVEYSKPGQHPYERQPPSGRASLSEIVWAYYDWSFEDLLKLRDRSSEINLYNYPASNIREVADEAPNPYYERTKYPPSIARYAEWVKYAGLAYAD